MKKILSIVLVTVLAFSLCACAGNKDASSKQNHTVDVAYYASLGKIPEIQDALGTNPDDILARAAEQTSSQDTESHTEDEYHVHTNPILTEIEGDLSCAINGGTYMYYYEKAKRAQGISYIVSLEKAYDFEIGAVEITPDYIKNALSNLTAESGTLKADDIFFLPDVSGNVESVVYIFEDRYKLQFVFVDGTFSAVVLYDMANWTL